jgi:hypothetical protein
MENQGRTRLCSRHCQPGPGSDKTPYGCKQICVPMTRDIYDAIWNDAPQVRKFLQPLIEDFPELFPAGIQEGYQLSGHLPESIKMPGIRLRQIRIGGMAYTLRPSFVMAYMTGSVEELENPLLFLSVGVPCWMLTRVFGHNDMFWYRQLERLGRNSLVGTTVRNPDQLPEHVAADEHHADWCGEKGFVAFTAGSGCVLGAALTASADEEHLTEAYGKFAEEARQVQPDYTPKTVNVDGWWATGNAFRALFAGIVTILCFLHGFLKIRDRCRKAYELHRRIWDVYRAATAEEFRKNMIDFHQWFEQGTWPAAVRDMVAKLTNRSEQYATSYDHPGCHRTSNLVDRLMNRLTRFLYAGRGLHGHQHNSELRLRGWALLQNFRPFAPRSNLKRQYHSPAHKLNQMQYHEHWLHNLQVSASLGGIRCLT